MYKEEVTSNLKPLGEMLNLFGEAVEVDKNGKPLSQRASLIRYFQRRARNRKGPLTDSGMGYLLSHLSKEDLFYMKSVLESETKRPHYGDQPAQSLTDKWNTIFWGMLKEPTPSP